MTGRTTTAAIAATLALGLLGPSAAAAQGRTAFDKVQQKVSAQLQGQGLSHRHLGACADDDGTRTDPDLAALEWLAGDWTGTGWTATEQGVTPYIQHERIRAVDGGAVLDVTGTGTDAATGEDVVFSAHATAVRDAAGAYVWTAESQGYTTVVEMEVGDGWWAWELSYAPGVTMRYETTSSHGGRAWHETGMITTDGGQTWTPTMEMTLIKTCDA